MRATSPSSDGYAQGAAAPDDRRTDDAADPARDDRGVAGRPPSRAASPVPASPAREGDGPDPESEARAPAGPGGPASLLDAVLAAPEDGDPLAALWRPRDRRPSLELAHVPFLFWLMGAARPRGIALLGLGDGVACHALCQAAERLGLEARIDAYAAPGATAALGPDYARHAEAAAAWHRVRTAAAEEAHRLHRGPVDLLCVLAPASDGLARVVDDRWTPMLSPRGVVLRFGTRPGAPGSHGPVLRMDHAGGLDVAAPGAEPPPGLASVLRDPEARRRAAFLFERLGEVWAGPGPASGARAEALAEAVEAAQRVAADALTALGERDEALGTTRERLGALELDHRLACERRDALWEAMQEARQARAQAETLARGEEARRAEAERRLTEAEATIVSEGAARAEADAAAKTARRERDEARRERARATLRIDPWSEIRAALLAAELAARRSRRGPLRDLRARMGQPSTRRQIATIRASALFDADWYRERHRDVAPLGRRLLPGDDAARLAAHYLNHGAVEGRDPGPGFDTRRYYLANPDVARAGWNALVHYELFGRAEGRSALPVGTAARDAAADAMLLEASELFDAEWYARRHPEIPAGTTAAEHYLTVGASAGHDPGPRFSTREYAEANADVEQAGINPLVHYLRNGRDEGRAARPGGKNSARRRVETMRTQLLSLGFTEAPLRGLQWTASSPRVEAEARERAALELGRWHLRRENGPDPAEALRWLDLAAEVARAASRDDATDRVAVMRLACLHALGRDREARGILDEARAAGATTPALTLAGSMLEAEEGARIARLNEVMRAFRLPDVALRAPEKGATLYDRLRTAGAPEPVTGGPLVSVIVAAFNAERTLPSTLQAMREQSWREHEVIVVDDASTDGTRAVAERFAAEDPRVRVLPLDRNVGAYAARNRALAIAKGAFVALQDADDWAHATRIEVQARHLASRPDLVACTSQQVRLRDDLTLAHFSANGDLIYTSIASLMFRRVPVLHRLGGWDEVRFSADHELIRRLHDAFSRAGVENLPTGPVTIQRFSEGSAIADLATGFSGAYSGARLEYFEAQRHHRKHGGAQRYVPGSRPFPVPVIMRPEARRGVARHHDVVIASELRMMGGSVKSCVEEIRAQRAAGLSTGLVKMYRYDLPQAGRVDTLSVVRDEVDGEAVTMLCFGEHVTCDLLIVRYPPVLRHPQRYLPRIEAGRVKVVVNQPPMSDYGPGGRRRYELAGAEANLRAAFGRPGEWHPIGPLVREALHEHHSDELDAIDLRAEDWINVVDVSDWDRGLGGGPRGAPGEPMRIGRHARDNPLKWPETPEGILKVYPEASDVEVHVLGGAEAPAKILGHLPRNWRVEGFNARPPRDFLADIDVFVYYTQPGWVESFGRSIVEAMAAGVPVVLPPVYEPVFGPHAAYARAEDALAAARRLHADPDAYRALTRRAQAMVRERYGYGLHLARLREAGVRGGGRG